MDLASAMPKDKWAQWSGQENKKCAETTFEMSRNIAGVFPVFCTTIVNDIYTYIVLYALDSDSIQLNQMLLPKHHYRVPPIVGQQGCTKFRRGWLIVMVMSQKSIAIFGKKQRLLSIDMKTKVVQHVPRIIFNVFNVFKFSKFSGSQRLSDFQTFLVTKKMSECQTKAGNQECFEKLENLKTRKLWKH